MDAYKHALQILVDAEGSLRELMQQEFDAKRYSELGRIAQLADGIIALCGSPDAEQPAPVATAPPDPSAKKPRTAQGKKLRKRAARTSGHYPRFERDQDKLVKIGWSKKHREEYEHRAPRAAIDAFVEQLRSRRPAGRLFAVEQLLPIVDASGDELPGYQVYLALAWLRAGGLIERKGRDGYVATSELGKPGAVDTRWSKLPVRMM